METQISEQTRAQIRRVLGLYKVEFDLWIPHELYKWNAVGWFQQNWSLNAVDFPAMLSEALSKTGNLMASEYWYPRDEINKLAKMDPDAVKEMFMRLLDEDSSLKDRISSFKDSASLLRKKYWGEASKKKTFQNDRAACLYLFLIHPEKYYLYQNGKFNMFAREIGLDPYRWNAAISSVPKYEKYMDLADRVREEVERDTSLISMLEDKLSNSWYQDKSHHLLTDDIFWFVYAVLRRSNYWPGEDEYNSGINLEQWKALLSNGNVCNEKRRKILLQMLGLGGEATCTQLAQIYGGTSQVYQNNMSDLAQAVQRETGCPIAETDAGEKKYWPILFIGRKASDGQPGSYSWKLRQELAEALESLRNNELTDTVIIPEDNMEIGKNIILYGPPGTGKTYQTINYAVAIVEGKPLPEVQAEEHSGVLARYQKYRNEGRIAFTTFHQSYGYEDFIEGIRPVFPDEGEEGDLAYDLVKGIFKDFCERAESNSADGGAYGFSSAPTVWKVSLAGTGENETRTYCMNNSCIRIGWDEYGEDISSETVFRYGGKSVLNAFLNRMQTGDIVLSCYSARTFDAIGVVTGEYEWHREFSHYKRLRKVRWLVKGQNLDIERFHLQKTLTLSTVYRLNTTAAEVIDVLQQIDSIPRSTNTPAPPYVFIIDEINRGNISKIFGELITLIEPQKRKGQPEETTAILPYSQMSFSIPSNVWILGTMNTADRSIALLDTALRRRFQFEELMPDSSVLDGIMIEDVSVHGILETLNRRITALYDREHILGHAWFLPLRSNPTLEQLGDIFRDSIIPLLQEYFYDDYEKIRLVLGDVKRNTSGGPQFFEAEESNALDLFGIEPDFPLNISYRLNRETLTSIDVYRNL